MMLASRLRPLAARAHDRAALCTRAGRLVPGKEAGVSVAALAELGRHEQVASALEGLEPGRDVGTSTSTLLRVVCDSLEASDPQVSARIIAALHSRGVQVPSHELERCASQLSSKFALARDLADIVLMGSCRSLPQEAFQPGGMPVDMAALADMVVKRGHRTAALTLQEEVLQDLQRLVSIASRDMAGDDEALLRVVRVPLVAAALGSAPEVDVTRMLSVIMHPYSKDKTLDKRGRVNFASLHRLTEDLCDRFHPFATKVFQATHLALCEAVHVRWPHRTGVLRGTRLQRPFEAGDRSDMWVGPSKRDAEVELAMVEVARDEMLSLPARTSLVGDVELHSVRALLVRSITQLDGLDSSSVGTMMRMRYWLDVDFEDLPDDANLPTASLVTDFLADLFAPDLTMDLQTVYDFVQSNPFQAQNVARFGGVTKVPALVVPDASAAQDVDDADGPARATSHDVFKLAVVLGLRSEQDDVGGTEFYNEQGEVTEDIRAAFEEDEDEDEDEEEEEGRQEGGAAVEAGAAAASVAESWKRAASLQRGDGVWPESDAVAVFAWEQGQESEAVPTSVELPCSALSEAVAATLLRALGLKARARERPALEQELKQQEAALHSELSSIGLGDFFPAKAIDGALSQLSPWMLEMLHEELARTVARSDAEPRPFAEQDFREYVENSHMAVQSSLVTGFCFASPTSMHAALSASTHLERLEEEHGWDKPVSERMQLLRFLVHDSLARS